MNVEVTFEEGDFDSMHDTLYDLTGHSYTHEELEGMWRKLPDDIQDEFIRWGGSDTCVGDSISCHYETLLKEKGIKHVDNYKEN